VLSQSFQDFELIVVNDASTDGSVSEVQRFTDRRIRLLHREEPGPGGYAARNLGIKDARAEWIAFLDADDEWYPEHLEAVHALCIGDNCGIIATGWLDSYPDGKKIVNSSNLVFKDNGVRRLSFLDFIEQSIKKGPLVNTNVITIRKQLLEDMGGFPEECRRGGDVATWLRLICKCNSIVRLPVSTAVYHREDSAVTRETAPEVENNCVYLAVRELLTAKLETKLTLSLKCFSNLHVSYGLVRRVSNGQLKWSDCKYHYFSANKAQHLFFRVCSTIPSFIQYRLWRVYREIKCRF
jgi:glycosyltransferase involved in cell wall biosynthesis